MYPIAVLGLITFTAAVRLAPDAETENEYSPSAKQPGDAPAPQRVPPATPFW